MIKLNIHEAKTHLSGYLRKLKKGETIILCKRNVPVAEVRLLSPSSKQPRKIGLAKGLVTIHDTFFDPLPDDLIGLFEGKNI